MRNGPCDDSSRAGRSEEEEHAAKPSPRRVDGRTATRRRRRSRTAAEQRNCKKRKDEHGQDDHGRGGGFLDGFIADDNDAVGPLFDWLGSGDVGWSLPGSHDEARTSRASADFMTSHYANTAANVIGRRLFDLTNGWDGKPAAFEHVFVVTHQPPTDWEHFGTAPFTFVDGVEEAIAAANEFAGDRDVDVAGGQIGSQALQLGLINQVVVNLVPVVFGSGRPFFATGALPEPLRLENPTTIVQGDRVTHLVYDVSR
jgi:dihydrofolate reductase